MNMYKSVSSSNLTKEDRGGKHIHNRTLRTQEVTKGTWPGFTTSEVRAALSNHNPSKALGPDKIHPKHLRNQSPKAVTFQQQLFNKSCETTCMPQGCRVADKRPVPKSGKYRQKLDNHRPISLTSTIMKVSEHLATNHICYEAETRRLLPDNQVGFQIEHSTEHQLLRLSQSISNSFQCSPMKRTVFHTY